MASASDVGVTVWSSLAGGVLSGKHNIQKRFSADNPMSTAFVNEEPLFRD